MICLKVRMMTNLNKNSCGYTKWTWLWQNVLYLVIKYGFRSKGNQPNHRRHSHVEHDQQQSQPLQNTLATPENGRCLSSNLHRKLPRASIVAARLLANRSNFLVRKWCRLVPRPAVGGLKFEPSCKSARKGEATLICVCL